MVCAIGGAPASWTGVGSHASHIYSHHRQKTCAARCGQRDPHPEPPQSEPSTNYVSKPACATYATSHASINYCTHVASASSSLLVLLFSSERELTRLLLTQLLTKLLRDLATPKLPRGSGLTWLRFRLLHPTPRRDRSRARPAHRTGGSDFSNVIVIHTGDGVPCSAGAGRATPYT